MKSSLLLPKIEAYRQAQIDFSTIPEDRKPTLHELISYVTKCLTEGKEINLNFICTHNSRRSQLSQLWASVAAYFYGIDVNTYSGGVEVTAFNERAVASIKRAGFDVLERGINNPKYVTFFSENALPLILFSKLYDDPINNKKEFAAIMTCSHADENCPHIVGSLARIPLRYEDPKTFDGTNQEAQQYDKRSLQIATELFYIFSNIQQ